MRPPGMPKTGGRKKGVPNKINSVARCAFLAVFENLRPDLESWIRETASTGNPGKAAELTIRLAEYHFPKAPTEITGSNNGPLVVEIVKYTAEE